ncbi:uncharacterized protein K444DRAFT_642737 [Hyaloscypha bicolor E]|uniref:Major facilitator superfamily (MFS) profile domain-containing protein n=1 Tax=Hyaloscypha bicolor E TaxID=1095630 RepID=A0A2J6TCQ8_9HELO|nr:uncharacterized protein K444DRAFT_642737 [Hyaloscypha bicolor E]PMD60815.1 hypothetical protein K444DRAFT_642737 [Hyaloscypha bicolor E]
MAGGSWLGALISGILSDRLGRRTSIMVGCLIWKGPSDLSSSAPRRISVGMLIEGRIVNGLVGIESAQVSVYVPELAPPSKRSRFVGAQQWPIYSPRWLARKDRWEECHSMLSLVHGKWNPRSPFVTLELEDIGNMCEFDRANKDVTYLGPFKPAMPNRTTIAVFTQIRSQLTGMNVMMYYICVWNGWLLRQRQPLRLLHTLRNKRRDHPSTNLRDRRGRRRTLLIGAALMGTWMFANAGILGGQGVVVPGGVDAIAQESMRLTGAAAKDSLLAYTFALATSSNWAFNLALGLFTSPTVVNIKWNVYLIFGIFNVAMFIHVFFLFPETSGKTPEETENMFEDPNGPRHTGTLAWKTRLDRHASILKMALATKQNFFDGRLGWHSREDKAEVAEI